MSKVYVVQVPASRVDGQWVPKYDLSAAEQFGELVQVLPFGNVPSDPRPTRARLFEVLSAFDPAEDFVLLLGDPVAMAQAVNVLTVVHGEGRAFYCLKWDRRRGRYDPYSVG